MSRWLSVDPDEIEVLEETRKDGITISLHISPYDVPMRVRGGFDDQKSRFVVEFSYSMDEKLIEQEHAENVVLSVGKSSGRIHKISIDVHAMKARHVVLMSNVPLKFTDAMSELRSTHPGRVPNIKAMEQVLRANRSGIFHDLAIQA